MCALLNEGSSESPDHSKRRLADYFLVAQGKQEKNSQLYRHNCSLLLLPAHRPHSLPIGGTFYL